MEHPIGLASDERKRAVDRLSAFIANSVANARAVEKPFFHIEFGRVFPDEVYRDVLRLMPVTRDYRPMHGRSKGLDLEDGTHTRVKIDCSPNTFAIFRQRKRGYGTSSGGRSVPSR